MYQYQNTPYLHTTALLTAMALPLSTPLTADFMQQNGIDKLKVFFPELNHEKWEQPDSDLTKADHDAVAKTIKLAIMRVNLYALVINDVVQELSTSQPNQNMSEAENDEDITRQIDWMPVPHVLKPWLQVGWRYDDELDSFVPPALATVKAEAIQRISDKANDYQDRIIGTSEEKRAGRFRANMSSAKALLAAIETDAQRDMLQYQLDANHYAEHPELKDATLDEFAEWIVTKHDDLTIRATGLIENVLIVGRAQVKKAQTVEQIDAILSGLSEQAETEFQALLNPTG